MKIINDVKNVEQILELINPAFAGSREEGFDFRNIMPKAYGGCGRYLQDHYIVKDQAGNSVAVAGNIPYAVNVGEKDYSFVFLGSVATLPQYRFNGYMRALMDKIESENIKNKRVFSLLTGSRKRYEYYGYTKIYSDLNFSFDKYNITRAEKIESLSIKAFSAKYLSQAFDIYKANQIILLRDEDNFEDYLKTGSATPYLIFKGDDLVGYYAFSRRKRFAVTELGLSDISLTHAVIKEIASFENIDGLTVCCSPLQVALAGALDQICEYSAVSDGLHVKVYDLARFIEMVVALNVKAQIIDCKNLQETIQIDGVNYCIIINEGAVSVEVAGENPVVCMSKDKFLRWAFNPIANALNKKSKIFPIAFGISAPDMF